MMAACLLPSGIYAGANKPEAPIAPADIMKIQDTVKETKLWDKTFQLFEDARLSDSGLYLDRMPNDAGSTLKSENNHVVSLAATGYGLAMDVLKAQRGFFGESPEASRKQVEARLMQTLDTVEKLSKKENGFFLPHFVHKETKANLAEYSTVDTMLFYMGAIAAGQYAGPEASARVEKLFNRLDFEMMRTRGGHTAFESSDNFSHGKDFSGEFIPYHWGGHYSEGVLLVNLMALGSTQNVPDTVWTKGWDRQKHWELSGMKTFERGPLFTYFYAQGFLDLKDKQDKQGENFWEASRQAVMIQQEYCRKQNYPDKLFGLSASDAPAPYGYRAYMPGNDDGTIAPPSFVASMPFIAESAEKVAHAAQGALSLDKLTEKDLLNSKYGIVNAYNVHTGWKATDALLIDVGSMALMMDAQETGNLHRLMGQSAIVKRAMDRAGFHPVHQNTEVAQGEKR